MRRDAKSWNIGLCPGRAGADAADDEGLESLRRETVQHIEDALACAPHGSQCHRVPGAMREHPMYI